MSLHKFEKAQVGPNVCISLISLSLLTQACVASPLAKKKKKSNKIKEIINKIKQNKASIADTHNHTSTNQRKSSESNLCIRFCIYPILLTCTRIYSQKRENKRKEKQNFSFSLSFVKYVYCTAIACVT